MKFWLCCQQYIVLFLLIIVNKPKLTLQLSLLLACSYAPFVLAEPAVIKPGNTTLSLAVGYGQYGNILHQGNATPLYLLPRVSYYRQRFYLENLDLGYNLWQHQGFSLDLTTKQSFDALLLRQDPLQDALLRGLVKSKKIFVMPTSSRLDQLLTPERRQFSYLTGISLFYNQQNWQLSSALQQDISKVHHGLEWQQKARYLWQSGPVALAVTAEYRYLSSNYSNYYFGVGPEDTQPLSVKRPELRLYQYQPGAQWLPALRLESSYQLKDNTRLLLNWRREWLPDAYQHSLYFAKRQHDIWFAGVLWSW